MDTPIPTRRSAFTFDEAKLRAATPYPLVATSLKGAFTTPAPAADFDPNTASPGDLVRAGLLWKRPDAGASRAVRDAWHKIMSRKWLAKDRIVPQFEVTNRRRHLLRARPPAVIDGPYNNTQWAGAAFGSGNWTGVIGTWVIPNVSKPSEPQGTEGGWHASVWIGIDGYGISNDVLQTGVELFVNAQGRPTYTAWYEWVAPEEPNSPEYIDQINIPNFNVSPGDQVSCSVQYINNNTAGYLYFGNSTTGQHFPITLAPPPGASFDGDTVEWILEAPDGGEPTASLPKFSPVEFTSALACGPGNAFGNPENAQLLNVETTSGQVLTNTTAGNDTVTVTFTG